MISSSSEKEFMEFRRCMEEHFQEMIQRWGYHGSLYVVDVPAKDLVQHFHEATQLLPEDRRFQCSTCDRFVKIMGGVVALNEESIMSLWDFTSNTCYDVMACEMSNFVKSHPIGNVFFLSKDPGFVKDETVTDTVTGESEAHHHLFVNIQHPLKMCDCVDGSPYSSNVPDYVWMRDRVIYPFNNADEADIERIKSARRSGVQSFERYLGSITKDAVKEIYSLCEERKLYCGSHSKLQSLFYLYLSKSFYDKEQDALRRNYGCWFRENSIFLNTNFYRVPIGQLILNISKGMDKHKAIRKYERIMAPELIYDELESMRALEYTSGEEYRVHIK